MEKMKDNNRLIYGLVVAALSLGVASCEEQLEIPAPAVDGAKTVEVPLSFGFADEEDGYTLSPAGTRADEGGQDGAFSARLVPAVKTRVGEATHPDALYEFHLMQYNQNNILMGSVQYKAEVPIGANFSTAPTSVTLTEATDCQLVVIVRGKGNMIPGIGGNLADVQKLVMNAGLFKTTIPTTPTQDDINKMPYVLHLPHVNVTADGKLQSKDGAYDARLLLKRLATKLKVTWTVEPKLAQAGYVLKEVKLCQVPSAFRLLPAEEMTQWGNAYPSAVAEYVDYYRLTSEAELAAGEKTVWIPANVRGNSVKATSSYYRTKDNAPTAASYMELVVDNTTKKERLYYRAYLGGRESTDFNLYENKDYNWDVHITSVSYQTDRRIELLDQTPVLSTNLVETANCLMMKPGTNICFNPYKHEAGTGGWNDQLVSGGSIKTNMDIATVKVLWQTKDTGTSGDLVMGYVIDDDHHENLVSVSDIGDKDKALVHVKVPVTQGGNAVIEAKNSAGTTVWSWHIWVSDYAPVGLDATGITNDGTRTAAIEAAQAATQGGMVQVYGGTSWTNASGAFYKRVIMDRNLGATRAGIQNNQADGIRTFGLLYQGGRKDPFFSTADGTTTEIKTIYKGDGNVIEKIEKIPYKNVPYQTLIEHPAIFYYPGGGQTLYSDKTSTWSDNRKKTIYDPCPDGWKVPLNEFNTGSNALYSLCAGFGASDPATVYEAAYGNDDNIMYWDGKQLTSMKSNGGVSKNGVDVPGAGFLYFGGSGESASSYSNKSAFFPGVSLREVTSGNYRSSVSNNSVFLWASTSNNTSTRYIYQIQGGQFSFRHSVENGYGFSVRCIQDNGN